MRKIIKQISLKEKSRYFMRYEKLKAEEGEVTSITICRIDSIDNNGVCAISKKWCLQFFHISPLLFCREIHGKYMKIKKSEELSVDSIFFDNPCYEIDEKLYHRLSDCINCMLKNKKIIETTENLSEQGILQLCLRIQLLCWELDKYLNYFINLDSKEDGR